MTAGPPLRRIGFHGHCMAGRDGTCRVMFMHRSAAHEDSPAHARCMIRLKQPPGRLESHSFAFFPLHPNSHLFIIRSGMDMPVLLDPLPAPEPGSLDRCLGCGRRDAELPFRALAD